MKKTIFYNFFGVAVLVALGFCFTYKLQLVFSQSVPAVYFVSANSNGSETVNSVNIAVKLSAASNQNVKVDYETIGGDANFVSEGTGKDYDRKKGTLTFLPGETSKNITLTVVNDNINEIDETIIVVLSNPQNAALGSISRHTYTIVDDDRGIIKSVTDYGAKPNDSGNDTAAIQAAVDDVFSKGGGSTGKGGVLIFPAGIYLVDSVKIRDNMTYQGYGAVIKRPAKRSDETVNDLKWKRTFTTQGYEYEGTVDSKPLIIKGLTFDGNSSQQGSYQNYEIEQSNLIFMIVKQGGGRLKTYLEDVLMKSGPATGYGAYNDTDLTMYNSTGENIFRGFFLASRNLKARIKNIVTRGKVDDTGIHSETYPSTSRFAPLDVMIEQYKAFDASLATFYVIVGAKFSLKESFVNGVWRFGGDGINLVDSRFKAGLNNGMTHFPWARNLNANNCEFIISEAIDEKKSGEADREMKILAANSTKTGTIQNGLLKINNSRFSVDSSVEAADTVLGFKQNSESSSLNNFSVFTNSIFSGNFDTSIFMNNGGNITIKDSQIKGSTGIRFSGSTNAGNMTLDGMLYNGEANSLYFSSSNSSNKMTLANIMVDEASNKISSSPGTTTITGSRLILGTNAPTASSNCLINDIYRLKTPISNQTHEWKCTKNGYDSTASAWLAQTTVPVIAYITNYPKEIVNSSSLNLNVAGSGVVSYKYKLDSDTWSAERSVSKAINLTNLSTGRHTISVIGKNSSGTWQSESRATYYHFLIQSDTQPPGGMVTINQGDILTDNNNVSLTIEKIDANPVTEMKISNRNDFNGAQVFPYAYTKDWTLLKGKGIQAVYVWLKDAKGNWMSEPRIDTIYLTQDGTNEPSSEQTQSPADLNSDGKVDAADFSIIKADFLKSSNLKNSRSDIDGDGTVTIKDVGIMMSGWGG